MFAASSTMHPKRLLSWPLKSHSQVLSGEIPSANISLDSKYHELPFLLLSSLIDWWRLVGPPSQSALCVWALI